MKQALQPQLEKYLSAGRVHPCLLFIGPEKEDKLEAALSFARSVFCSQKKGNSFCGECSSCKRIEKGIFPDLLLFRENDEEALKVENVRDIIYQMEVAPLEGKAKVCIVEEAHRMNAASSNAFLKTLEEPKENRYFVLLTTKPGALLPTLISRSLQFHFKPRSQAVSFSPEEIKEFESLFLAFQKDRNADPIIRAFEEKEECLKFLQFLQVRLHDRATGNKTESLFASLPEKVCPMKHQKVVELEGKLKSQANFGLLLEALLREEF